MRSARDIQNAKLPLIIRPFKIDLPYFTSRVTFSSMNAKGSTLIYYRRIYRYVLDFKMQIDVLERVKYIEILKEAGNFIKSLGRPDCRYYSICFQKVFG